MIIEFPSIESALSGKNILFVTNHTRTDLTRQHLLTSYPPDTLLVYQQAALVLGANLLQLTFDDAIQLLSTTDDKVEKSLLINLAAGLKSIALEGVIPGLSGLHNIPVFPASILNQVIAEDKLVSKRMAMQIGLRCSTTYSEHDLFNVDEPIIIKPIVGTDSVGIEKIENASQLKEIPIGHFVEEFIPGDDVTIHMWWNNYRNQYEILDCFLRETDSDDWYDRSSKMYANLIFNNTHISRTSVPINSICSNFKKNMFDFTELIGRPYIARLDFRFRAGAQNFNSDSLYFLEINAIPTISNANDWWSGITALSASSHQKSLIDNLDLMPIHPAAKSIAFFINEFYVQSLSKHNDN